MKFRIEHIVIVGLLIWVIVQTCRDRDPEPNTEPWKRTIAEKEVKIEELGLQNQALFKQVQEDSIIHLETQSVLISQGNAWKQEVVRLKRSPKVIEVLKQNPEVDSLVVAQDSVIQYQGYQIEALEISYGKLGMNMLAITSNFESQLELHRQRFEASQQLTAQLEKDLRKQKRKTKLAKVLVPVAFVGGILLGGL